MREKRRYLLLKIDSETPFDERSAKHLLYSAAFSFLGERGAAKAGVRLKAFDEKKQEAVVACSLAALEEVIAALALKRKHENRDVAIRLEKISGAICNLQ